MSSTNFFHSKVCWQQLAMFWLYNFSVHNLNYHWRSWWDLIQPIFLNLFYFTFQLWYQSSCFLRRPQKLMKSSPSIWHYIMSKRRWRFFFFFLAFLESINIILFNSRLYKAGSFLTRPGKAMYKMTEVIQLLGY